MLGINKKKEPQVARSSFLPILALIWVKMGLYLVSALQELSQADDSG